MITFGPERPSCADRPFEQRFNYLLAGLSRRDH